MKKYIDIICPISSIKADENITRTTAIFTVFITAVAILINSYIIMLLLAVDFAIRAFSTGRASPLKNLAIQTTRILKINNGKRIDAAPKKFAALLGMTFSFLAGLFMIVNLSLTAVIIASMLIFCAFLEGVFSYCVGCVVYTLITKSSGKS